jgi:hypothetical protein
MKKDFFFFEMDCTVAKEIGSLAEDSPPVVWFLDSRILFQSSRERFLFFNPI